MLTVVLGMAVFLQVGAPSAGPEEHSESVEQADCPSDSAGTECLAGEAVVPQEAPAAPAPVAVAAPAPRAFATVSFRNDVGNRLRLVEARFTMDGQQLPAVLTGVEPGKNYVIVSGAVTPGPHVVSAHLTYRGDHAVFSYMKGYQLNVKSEQVLTAPANRTVSFTVVGRENKGMTVSLDKRVVVTVIENGASGQ
jgi:hypothetical protein